MDHFSYRPQRDPGSRSASPGSTTAADPGVTGPNDDAGPPGELLCEWLPVSRIVEVTGTPTLILSASTIVDRFYAYAEAYSPLRPMVCWDATECNIVEVMRSLRERGSAFEVTSGDDLERAWLAGATFSRVIFSGYGKQPDEIRAALDGLYSPLYSAGALVESKPPYYRGPVAAFIAEDHDDLEQIARIAGGLRITCRVLLRRGAPGRHGFTDDRIRSVFAQRRGDRRVRLVGIATRPIDPDSQSSTEPRAAVTDAGSASTSVQGGYGSGVQGPAVQTTGVQADLDGAAGLIRALISDGHEVTHLHLAAGFDGPARWPIDDRVHTARLFRVFRSLVDDQGLQVSLAAPRSLVGQASVLVSTVLGVHDSSDEHTEDTSGLARATPRMLDLLCDLPCAASLLTGSHRPFIWPTIVAAEHMPGYGTPLSRMPGTKRVAVSSLADTYRDARPITTTMPPAVVGTRLAVFHDTLPSIGRDVRSRHGRGVTQVIVSHGRARLLNSRQDVAKTLPADTESVDLGL